MSSTMPPTQPAEDRAEDPPPFPFLDYRHLDFERMSDSRPPVYRATYVLFPSAPKSSPVFAISVALPEDSAIDPRAIIDALRQLWVGFGLTTPNPVDRKYSAPDTPATGDSAESKPVASTFEWTLELVSQGDYDCGPLDAVAAVSNVRALSAVHKLPHCDVWKPDAPARWASFQACVTGGDGVYVVPPGQTFYPKNCSPRSSTRQASVTRDNPMDAYYVNGNFHRIP